MTDRLFWTIGAVAEDIAALLRDCATPDAPIPGAEWTVAEAAAHLALANELMADLAAGAQRPYGDGTPGGLAAANAASLAAWPERDAGRLADAVLAHARAFTAAAGQRPPETPVVTPMGSMDLATLGSYLLTHMLGHGWDLARALRRPHMMDRQRVELCLPFLLLAMPRVVDAEAVHGLTARYIIGLRGGRRFGAVFDDGRLSVHEQPLPRPDCTIITEPVSFLLMALGRRGPWSALARGAVLAWGPRPWLAPRFPLCFRAP
jgi:uncharacterized protein (TIGR03083 family)